MDYVSPDSYWLHSTAAPATYPPLSGDTTVDVAIIGAGITGLSAADFLKRRGMSVAVIEAGRVGAGTTSGTSGHLDFSPEVTAGKLISAFGADAAHLVILGRERAIKIISDRSHDLPDCEFQRISGFLYSERTSGAEVLQQELSDCAKIGLNVSAVKEIGLPFPTTFAMEFPGQARFQPMAYLRGLANSVHGDGSAIYEGTRAKTPSSGGTPHVETEHGTVTAKAIITAVHCGSYLRVAPYQSYCILARTEFPVADALYWDDADPYHYIRRANGSDPHLLVIGGEDHKTGQGDPRQAFENLHAYARAKFGTVTVERRWSAELFNPVDGLPFVGHVPLNRNCYIATGFGGEGLTYGVLAGELLADLILGRKNDLAEILSPSRVKPMAAAKEFAKENFNAAKEYVVGHLSKSKIESLDDINAGEGKVGVYQDEHLAIFRDTDGELYASSPVCTHAGCIVNWNSIEKTWDCPCHGGRFTAKGERLYGPPPIDLERRPIPTGHGKSQ